MYGKLLDLERAETSLNTAMKEVNEGLSEQAIEAGKHVGTYWIYKRILRNLKQKQKKTNKLF